MENTNTNYTGMTIGDLLDNPVFDVNCEIVINKVSEEGRIETVYSTVDNFGSFRNWVNKKITYITTKDDELIVEFKDTDCNDWILEGMGNECILKHFATKEEAMDNLVARVNNICDALSLIRDYADYWYFQDGEFMAAQDGVFQGYMVYKEPFTKKEKMQVEVNRAMMGVVQYQFELEDADTINGPLSNLKEMIDEMEEE